MSDDQLSRHERSVLEVIEGSLVLDDPTFVVRFNAEAQALDGRTGPRWNPLAWLRGWLNRDQGF